MDKGAILGNPSLKLTSKVAQTKRQILEQSLGNLFVQSFNCLVVLLIKMTKAQIMSRFGSIIERQAQLRLTLAGPSLRRYKNIYCYPFLVWRLYDCQ